MDRKEWSEKAYQFLNDVFYADRESAHPTLLSSTEFEQIDRLTELYLELPEPGAPTVDARLLETSEALCKAKEEESVLSFELKMAQQERDTRAATVKANAVIDGSNEQKRKQQELQTLVDDDEYQGLVGKVMAREAMLTGISLRVELARIRFECAKELVRWDAAHAGDLVMGQVMETQGILTDLGNLRGDCSR